MLHGIPSMQDSSLMLDCRKNQPPNGCDPSEGPPLQTFPNFLVVLDREREALPRIGKEGGDRADAGGARPTATSCGGNGLFVSNNCGTALAEKFSDAPTFFTGLSLCCTGLGLKAFARFGGFCSCCCLPLLPELACHNHTTWQA